MIIFCVQLSVSQSHQHCHSLNLSEFSSDSHDPVRMNHNELRLLFQQQTLIQSYVGRTRVQFRQINSSSALQSFTCASVQISWFVFKKIFYPGVFLQVGIRQV